MPFEMIVGVAFGIALGYLFSLLCSELEGGGRKWRG